MRFPQLPRRSAGRSLDWDLILFWLVAGICTAAFYGWFFAVIFDCIRKLTH